MLIVKDFKKLEAHGFHRNIENYQGLVVWEKVLGEKDNGDSISLLVNPLFTEHSENEMFIYATTDDEDEVRDECMDMTVRIDDVFEMLADGTIEYVKEDK